VSRRRAPNFYAPDGYRYGVRHRDGSVSDRWNGSTQLARARQARDAWQREALAGPFAANYMSGDLLIVRQRAGSPTWEVVCDYAEPGQARCAPAICDCFYDEYPADPFGVHPEAFVVQWPQPVHAHPCPTPGCPGDGWQPAPGHGHLAGCEHPREET
jgi:hypothetical protein